MNISVNALDEDCFFAITRRHGAAEVKRAIARALAVPGLTVKLNCVPIGVNDGELAGLAALARDNELAVRFIEKMPIGEGRGGACRTTAEVRAMLEAAFGPLTPTDPPLGSGPCRYFTAAGFAGTLGFISAVTLPFCDTCNRVRLTARGFFKTCLQYRVGTDLRALLRAGADDGALADAILAAVEEKPAGHRFADRTVPDGEPGGMSQIGG